MPLLSIHDAQLQISTSQPIRSQEIRDNLVSTSSILVEIDMMACTRVKIRREFGVLVVRPRRLVEDAFAVAVADNVIGFAGNGLRIKGVSSSHVRRWACRSVHGC